MKSDPAFKPLLDKKEAAKEPQDSSLASNLYNGMVHPLIPFAIKGAIWYQGESNAPRAEQYRTLFPALITDWRKQWGQGDFPFIWVQLPNFKQRKTEPADSDWAELREAQSMALKLPNTAQAVIIDIGEANDIHPKNKHDVGKRLALAAQRIAYGKNDVVRPRLRLDENRGRSGAAEIPARRRTTRQGRRTEGIRHRRRGQEVRRQAVRLGRREDRGGFGDRQRRRRRKARRGALRMGR
jgi:hypothetical protein